MSSEAQMYRRELEINGTSLSFETGKYAKQADGSVDRAHGRIGGPGNGVRIAESARGHRLSPADGRLQGIHVRVGPHSGRVLQARRQAVRKGSADEPRDRSAHPAAVSRRVAQRVADHRARAVGRCELRSGRARHQRRLCRAGALEHPLPERRSPACAWGRSTGSS